MTSPLYILRPAIGRALTVTIVAEADAGHYYVKPTDGGGRRRVAFDDLQPVDRKAPSPGRLVRTPSYIRTSHLRPSPKAPRWESAAYLGWIRKRPCCVCGTRIGIQAAHFGPDSGMSRKASDVYVSAQCAGCHREWHELGRFRDMTRQDSEELMLRAQRDALAAWVMEVGGG